MAEGNGEKHYFWERKLVDISEAGCGEWNGSTTAKLKSSTFFTSVPSTKYLGNMVAPGRVHEGKSMMVYTLGVYVGMHSLLTGANTAALLTQFLEGLITFIVGDDTKMELPCHMLPNGGGAQISGNAVTASAGAVTTNVGSNGIADPRARHIFDPPIEIPRDYTFKVEYDRAAELTMVADFNVDVIIGGRLY